MNAWRRALVDSSGLLLLATVLALIAHGLAAAVAVRWPGLQGAGVSEGLRSVLWTVLAVGASAKGRQVASERVGAVDLLLAVGSGGVLLVWCLLVAWLFTRWAQPSVQVAPGSGPLWALVSVLLGPVGEEWLFRGALVARLRRGLGPAATVVCSALAFALFHLQPQAFATALGAGLLLGALRLQRGAVWPCMLAHALCNALILV